MEITPISINGNKNNGAVEVVYRPLIEKGQKLKHFL